VVPPGQSPYAGWITYAYGQDIRREIYLMNPTTGETKQLTNNLFQDDSPSFSPDNLEIVFTSYREPDGWELFVLNLETEEERQITAFEGIVRFPVWSPKAGDDRIVFDGVQGQLNQQFTNLWMVEGSGRGLVQVTDSGADSGANWSPDGMRLVYSHAEKDTNGDKRITASDMGNIYILDLLTNESQRITWSSTRNDFNFSWSPDAAWIVYCSVRSDSNHDGRLTLDDSRNLYMIKPDGKEDHMIDVGGRAVFWPGWSPDGKMIIVYEPRGSTIGRFWLYDTGTGKINILTSIGPYGRPQYSK
jgi:Tol biopolymer transport system component